MTDAVIIAIVTGSVTTIGALITAVVSIRTSRKTDKLATKTDEIHVVTNNAKQLVDRELKAANKRIAKLEETISKFVGKRAPSRRTKPR